MTYQFDDRGNLSPYQLISVDSLDEFEEFFVSSFSLSTTRNIIYSGLLTYLSDFGALLHHVAYEGEWTVWLNGSFTTNKTSPADVDVLNILNDTTVLRMNKSLFKPFFADNAQRKYGVDAYFLLMNESSQTKDLLTYWQKWLGTDRAGFEKGIIKVIISF